MRTEGSGKPEGRAQSHGLEPSGVQPSGLVGDRTRTHSPRYLSGGSAIVASRLQPTCKFIGAQLEGNGKPEYRSAGT